MKLTKLQRFTAYVIMLHEFKKHNTGFCLIWLELTGDKVWEGGSCYDLRDVLPELSKRSTNIGSRMLWFNNHEQREQVIKECILETHP